MHIPAVDQAHEAIRRGHASGKKRQIIHALLAEQRRLVKEQKGFPSGSTERAGYAFTVLAYMSLIGDVESLPNQDQPLWQRIARMLCAVAKGERDAQNT